MKLEKITGREQDERVLTKVVILAYIFFKIREKYKAYNEEGYDSLSGL